MKVIMEGAASEIGKIIQENRIRKEMGIVSFTEMVEDMPVESEPEQKKKEPLNGTKSVDGASDSKSL